MLTEEQFLKEVRNCFPFFANNSEDWILYENAGGSQTLSNCIGLITQYLSGPNVQLRAHNELSDGCMKKISEGVRSAGILLNAKEPQREICLGSSTTQLLLNLSLAIEPTLNPTDEIVVTNCDHESNIGCWRRMAERKRLQVREWQINPQTFQLEPSTLATLLNDKTRVVAFTHCSNVLGTIVPVKEMVKIIRYKAPNALIIVDGVAYAAHRSVDVQDLDVDFYAFSFYKTFGPHLAVLYGKKDKFKSLKNINHFYITEEGPRKIQPGNFAYEFAYSVKGINEYLCHIARKFGSHNFRATERQLIVEAFELISKQEEEICKRLMRHLNSKPDVFKIIGSNEFRSTSRVPTVSFVVKNVDSEELCSYLSRRKIAAKFGDCYTRRMCEFLGLLTPGCALGGNGKGVVRISMVHYNSVEEVVHLIKVIEEGIKALSQDMWKPGKALVD